MIPEPMPFIEEVARSVGYTMVGCEIVRSLVVLECASTDRCPNSGWEVQDIDGFAEETFQRKKSLQGVGESGIFRFQC